MPNWKDLDFGELSNLGFFHVHEGWNHYLVPSLGKRSSAWATMALCTNSCSGLGHGEEHDAGFPGVFHPGLCG